MAAKPLLILTFNDQPSGVYASQVSDVCRFYEEELKVPTRLVACISIRGYFANRKIIRRSWKHVTVLPMVPGLKRWRWNFPLLWMVWLFMGKGVIVARNPFACALALKLKKWKRAEKICYDGRGAVYEEWKEYKLTEDMNLLSELKEAEKKCVLESDGQLAVSAALADYWKKTFSISGAETFVIPCTLNDSHRNEMLTWAQRMELRKNEGYAPDEMVLVYSGSDAGWQSPAQLENHLMQMLATEPKVKVLLLSNMNEMAARLSSRFPQRVKCEWLSSQEAFRRCQLADYGLLLRESSITNAVSSPSKFAEYLSAGLPVIISPGIGDFTSFVGLHGCGFVASDSPQRLNVLTETTRNEMMALAKNHFSKKAFSQSYLSLIESRN